MAWIARLRARLARGVLARLPPIELGHGGRSLPAEHIVRIMLADLDGFENLDPDEAEDPFTAARHHHLIGDFRCLRFLLR